MSQSWVDDTFRWWHNFEFVSSEARAARRLDEAAALCAKASEAMAEARGGGAFGLSADLRKEAEQLRSLAEACVAELNEGDL